jgi:putative (di)nucleoside polyphosphate hydrolase
MPQGGIDPGESPIDAAFRELEEEIGTAKAELLAEAEDWLNYDLPHDLVAMLWQGRFRGQTQKWFAMRFTGVDANIDIETENPEFLEWKWAEVSALPDLIVPFKRDLYAELVSRFGHLAEKLRSES